MKRKRIVWSLWLIWLYIFKPDRFYDLMGLVRGPDPELEILKKLYSARLRYFLFRPPKSYVYRYRSELLRPVDIYELADVLAALKEKEAVGRWPFRHYAGHAKTAFAVLKNIPAVNRCERYELEALHALAERFEAASEGWKSWQEFDPCQVVGEWYREWFQ